MAYSDREEDCESAAYRNFPAGSIASNQGAVPVLTGADEARVKSPRAPMLYAVIEFAVVLAA
ncbi:hypothetical protein WKW82_14410 [Variovorax rhizosphaerae]|uniref:Uncharacterized protein n=1 Tax=Variovorax rhizosphaerae TaxID=1836200 RepID=A0ABU8WLV5_9BURK